MSTDFRLEFIEESKQVLKSLEQSLLRLEKNSSDPEEINNAYRYLHTLKGGAGMFGFDEVERLAHELEDIYSDVRDGIRLARSRDAQQRLVSEPVVEALYQLLYGLRLIAGRLKFRFEFERGAFHFAPLMSCNIAVAARDW